MLSLYLVESARHLEPYLIIRAALHHWWHGFRSSVGEIWFLSLFLGYILVTLDIYAFPTVLELIWPSTVLWTRDNAITTSLGNPCTHDLIYKIMPWTGLKTRRQHDWSVMGVYWVSTSDEKCGLWHRRLSWQPLTNYHYPNDVRFWARKSHCSSCTRQNQIGVD